MCALKKCSCNFFNLKELRSKLRNKKDSEMFQIQKYDLNNGLDEEHPLHEPNNLEECDADYEPNKGVDPIDSVEQR